jgi:Fe-S-cluster formation regulator IscX/YfhJ
VEVETDRQSWLLGPDNWPVTVEEAVRDILPRIPRFTKFRLMFMKKEELDSLHLEIGLWIRNRYGLWRGNEKLIVSACGFRCHPDDASGKIIEAVWQALHK